MYNFFNSRAAGCSKVSYKFVGALEFQQKFCCIISTCMFCGLNFLPVFAQGDPVLSLYLSAEGFALTLCNSAYIVSDNIENSYDFYHFS